MNAEDRKRVEAVLRKIPQVDWDEFLRSEGGAPLRLSMSAARAALDAAGVDLRGRTPKPAADIVHMLGANLLGDATAGPMVRFLIVRSLSPSRWERLRKHYRELAPARGKALHGNMVQNGAGADVVSAYWHRGSHWARRFCEVAGLPPALVQPSADIMLEDEVVVSSRPLAPLHDFQVEVYRQLRKEFLTQA